MSDILSDLANDPELQPASADDEVLPDPSLMQRIVGAVTGIGAYAVIFSLGQILVLSRVPSPFTWIPGFALVFASVVGFQIARSLVLAAFGVNDERLESARPLRWLVNAVVGVAAISASSALLVFLLLSTPMYQLQGDYPPFGVHEASEQSSPASAAPSRTEAPLTLTRSSWLPLVRRCQRWSHGKGRRRTSLMI